MLDTLNRRLRHKRSPSGKSVKINDRDLKIISLLFRYRYLSSHNLIAYFKPKSKKRFTERLGQLYHDTGLVDRPIEQWELARSGYSHIVYSLSKKGKRLLSQEKRLPKQAVIYPADRPNTASPQFLHTLKTSQVIFHVELNTFSKADQRFVSLDEIRKRQLSKGRPFKLEFPVTIPISKDNPHTVHKTMVRPDGLYGIEYSETGNKLYRFFAVEVERTSPKRRYNMRLSSTVKKNLAYQAAIKSGIYRELMGIPKLELALD